MKMNFFGIHLNPESEIHLGEAGNFSWKIHTFFVEVFNYLEKARISQKKAHLSFQKQS
jgi:hypothetical protein